MFPTAPNLLTLIVNLDQQVFSTGPSCGAVGPSDKLPRILPQTANSWLQADGAKAERRPTVVQRLTELRAGIGTASHQALPPQCSESESRDLVAPAWNTLSLHLRHLGA
ncbi:unnamed protein product, partial [Clonostachys byssicola]